MKLIWHILICAGLIALCIYLVKFGLDRDEACRMQCRDSADWYIGRLGKCACIK